MKYRSFIQKIIQQVIYDKTPEKSIYQKLVHLVNQLQLPDNDYSKLVETLEVEILSLHEGNIARYQIRPNEFKSWKEVT